MSTADERDAATKAQEVIAELVPGSKRTDHIAFRLRHAAALATEAIKKGFSSDAALNNVRGEAVIALNGTIGLVERQALTQEMIDRARDAVAAWLSALGN
jgi:hypothetical protein